MHLEHINLVVKDIVTMLAFIKQLFLIGISELKENRYGMENLESGYILVMIGNIFH